MYLVVWINSLLVANRVVYRFHLDVFRKTKFKFKEVLQMSRLKCVSLEANKTREQLILRHIQHLLKKLVSRSNSEVAIVLLIKLRYFQIKLGKLRNSNTFKKNGRKTDKAAEKVAHKTKDVPSKSSENAANR